MIWLSRMAPWLLVGLLVLGVAAGAASGQEYTIGARDVLGISVWGQGDLSRDYTVDPDGFVPFPLVGRTKAAGLTPKELAAWLTELLFAVWDWPPRSPRLVLANGEQA